MGMVSMSVSFLEYDIQQFITEIASNLPIQDREILNENICLVAIKECISMLRRDEFIVRLKAEIPIIFDSCEPIFIGETIGLINPQVLDFFMIIIKLQFQLTPHPVQVFYRGGDPVSIETPIYQNEQVSLSLGTSMLAGCLMDGNATVYIHMFPNIFEDKKKDTVFYCNYSSKSYR